MATVAERIAELEAELVVIKTAITAIRTGGQARAVGEFSVSGANLSELIKQRNQCERDIQRLRNGDRGFSVDLQGAADG